MSAMASSRVVVDGKISRGARCADGTRVHLLGVAEHGRASRQTIYAVTSLTRAHATAQDIGRLVREYWSIEAHHIHRNTPGGLIILQTCKNCSNYVR